MDEGLAKSDSDTANDQFMVWLLLSGEIGTDHVMRATCDFANLLTLEMDTKTALRSQLYRIDHLLRHRSSALPTP
jgi:hypothetical protein